MSSQTIELDVQSTDRGKKNQTETADAQEVAEATARRGTTLRLLCTSPRSRFWRIQIPMPMGQWNGKE